MGSFSFQSLVGECHIISQVLVAGENSNPAIHNHLGFAVFFSGFLGEI